MENQIQIFENKDFGKVRVIEINGQIWFVGKDAAEVLGYENGSRDIKRHVDEDDIQTAMIPQYQNGTLVSKTLIINESGLYSLIMSSKLPGAKTFKRWVTSEILPSIRKHGAYITDDMLVKFFSDIEASKKFYSMMIAERSKKEALVEYIDAITPKALYCDIILQCNNAIPVSIIAKDYGITAIAFNKLLNALKIQYNINGTWLLCKEYSNHGYTITRTYHVNDKKSTIHTYWTQKGRRFLYELLKRFEILPQVEKGGFYA